MSRRYSRPKPPIMNRISPPLRRQQLQVRIAQEIPHYFCATPEHTHHALELVEAMVDREEIPNILDSDEKVVGFLYARCVHKYGDEMVLTPEQSSGAFAEGYNLYREAVVTE